MDERTRRGIAVVTALLMVLMTIKGAMAAGVEFSKPSPLAVNLNSNPMLAVEAKFTDEYGRVVSALKSTADIVTPDNNVVLTVNGIEESKGTYLFQKDLAGLAAGNYELQVHLDGNQGVEQLVLVRYPAGFGMLYENGVLQRGRVIVAFIVLGVVAFLAIIALIYFKTGRGRSR